MPQPRMMLVVTGDDFGYCPKRNQGIVDCFQAGGISNVSLLVNAAAAKEAADLAKRHNIPIGLHANLSEGIPVCQSLKQASTLLNQHGFFHGKMGFRQALERHQLSMEQVHASKIPDEDEGTNDRTLMYYVNDGVYGSFNCILYDHAQCLPTLHKKPKPDEAMYPCSIWGPTCDGLDRIVEQCYLPDLQVGDWLVFENMGAYTVAASSTFNGFQRPDIHYVMSRPAWQHVQQICFQGMPAPLEESRLFEVSACCGQESSLEMPTKPCQARVV